MKSAKILLLDIETAPILAYVWGLWNNDVGLNQIKSDWHLLSWAAKWLHEPASKIMYMDQRYAKNVADDKKILGGIWKLLDEAEVIVTQNGKKFDERKLNARFVINGFKPPSTYKHVDTRQIAKKKLGLTSNSLEYMSDKLNKKFKKSKHKKFIGMDLWTECLSGNRAAWKEMEKYNKLDVLALEELYVTLQPWDTSINLSVFSNSPGKQCNCGSTLFIKNGYAYTNSSKYQRFACTQCGANHRSKENLFNKNLSKEFKVKV